jgi:hypothetical protein
MYVRFHSPWAQVRCGVHHGLFGPAYGCARDAEVPASLREALWHEIDWFEEHLPAPRRRAFLVKSRKRWRADGICWFADSAREMIGHAFALAWLLRDCGVPVTKVATRRPGQVLYRDAWQIVAKPDPATPTRWH